MATNLIPSLGIYIVERKTGTNMVPAGFGYIKETTPATVTNGPIVTMIGAP